MRIPVLYIPGTAIKKFLHIEKMYSFPKKIITIGCDCHPAYSLQSLYIRTESLPFDWLNVAPAKSIGYVADNIRTNFEFFLKDLRRNDEGHIVSSYYPFAEFIHEKQLIERPEDVARFKRRVTRFLDLIQTKDINYLHNTPAAMFSSPDEVNQYIESIKSFLPLLKKNDSLHIYIRFDENLEENKEIIDSFIEQAAALGVSLTNYNRKFSKYGLWGNPAEYKKLYENLKLPIKFKKWIFYFK